MKYGKLLKELSKNHFFKELLGRIELVRYKMLKDIVRDITEAQGRDHFGDADEFKKKYVNEVFDEIDRLEFEVHAKLRLFKQWEEPTGIDDYEQRFKEAKMHSVEGSNLDQHKATAVPLNDHEKSSEGAPMMEEEIKGIYIYILID